MKVISYNLAGNFVVIFWLYDVFFLSLSPLSLSLFFVEFRAPFMEIKRIKVAAVQRLMISRFLFTDTILIASVL